MSISEARRQAKLLEDLADEYRGNGSIRALSHAVNAIVEALAENKPYDGTLNNIRVPVPILRQLTVELVQQELDDVGLEDLIVSIRARIRHKPQE
jgi:hypothetical protein